MAEALAATARMSAFRDSSSPGGRVPWMIRRPGRGLEMAEQQA
jgi:hypothetical protein